ncbi:MAG: AzlD domain-containing protein [Marinobacterium sp.]|nr:AzlD domain-containing protein [Marinobacterium sp.]
MDIWLICAMALITFTTRYLSLALYQRLPNWLLHAHWLRYISTAMLSALLAKAALIHEQQLQLTTENPILIAGLATLVCLLCQQSRPLSFLAGLLTFALVR